MNKKNIRQPRCRKKVEYNHLWRRIDELCEDCELVRDSFASVFGIAETSTYGDKACNAFNEDIEVLIGSLEKVTYLLKGDTTSQKNVAEILYESSVALHSEHDNLDVSLESLDLDETTDEASEVFHPVKRRRLSLVDTPPPKKDDIKFKTPEPYSEERLAPPSVSIAKIALSEAKKSGQKVTSLDDFLFVKPISKGAFGKVYLAKRKSTGEHFAVKIMKKEDLIKKNMVDQVVTERDALALIKSPFIVKLFYSFQSPTDVYLVMEYLIGGDLCSVLATIGAFDEEHAMLYAAELALALSYLHKHNIIHKDIKPENMLINKLGHIKLTDFGLSSLRLQRKLTISDLVNTPTVGSTPYNHGRTPGQLLSLTSNLGFNATSPIVAGNEGDSKDNVNVTPLVKKKKFVPKRCSFGSNVKVSAYSTHSLSTDFKTPESVSHHNKCKSDDSSKSNLSWMEQYRDNDVSFGSIDAKTFERVKKFSDVDLINSKSPISGVIGTPDYIAPELLLRRVHTASADWWSFGICLYEFITGIPPFADSTIGNIFRNILNMEVEWPDDCSEGVKDLIISLLQYEPENRLDFNDVKHHTFFNTIPWDNILETEMPFVPMPENETDTGYFEGHNNALNIKLSDFDGCNMGNSDSGVFSKNM